MVALPDVFYPSSDGEPVAETYVHFYALLLTLEVLQQYLTGREATVLANQFLYYTPGEPQDRVAPDVMVIFDVQPGGRDNYKIWEEGQVPAVIFEMTSKSTEKQDRQFKKDLYERLGVQEYWLFDPKGEWIAGQLLGYRLEPVQPDASAYSPITDNRSAVLGLRLGVEAGWLRFWREDTGEKLLIPAELAEGLAVAKQQAEAERRAREQAEQQAEQQKQQAEAERQAREQAEQQVEQERLERERAERQAQRLAERLRALGIDPDAG